MFLFNVYTFLREIHHTNSGIENYVKIIILKIKSIVSILSLKCLCVIDIFFIDFDQLMFSCLLTQVMVLCLSIVIQ